MVQLFYNIPLAELKPIFKEWFKEAQMELHSKQDLFNKRYSIKESAKILGVIPLTVRNHIKNGNIKAEKLGRKYYILHSELYGALNEVKSLKYKR